MMTEARRRRGPQPAINDDELRALVEKGMSGSAIARELGVSATAVNKRLQRLREKDQDRAAFLLPWAVRSEHADGYVYRAVLAYGHRMRGEALNQRQRTELAELEAFLHQHDAVVTYDYNQGFMIRNRRPGDGPSLVV